MNRQKPEDYNPEKDSPLLGGYGHEDKYHLMGYWDGDGGVTRAISSAEICSLLETAHSEFPEPSNMNYYPRKAVEEWLEKWMKTPPV